MSSTPLPVTLHISRLTFHTERWWTTSAAGSLVNAVTSSFKDQSGNWRWKPRTADAFQALDPAHLREALAGLPDPTQVVVLGPAGISLEFSLRLGFTDLVLRISNSRDLHTHTPSQLVCTLIDICLKATSLQEAAGLARFAQIDGPDVPYPRPSPPPASVWPMNALALVVSTNWHHANRTVLSADIDRLQTAELSPGTSRELRGESLILRWTEDLDDLPTARSRAHMWMGKVVSKGQIEAGYNDLGDKLYTDLLPTRPAHGPFERYDRTRETGYLAVRPDAMERLEEVRQWLSARRMPDGTPLKTVRLITDTRKEALEVAATMTTFGIRHVFYRSEHQPDKHVWNPFPPGPWL